MSEHIDECPQCRQQRILNRIFAFAILMFLFCLGMIVFHGEGRLVAQAPVYGQQLPKAWKLWGTNSDVDAAEGKDVALYKVQDGNCSVYIVFAKSNTQNAPTVSVATGQGCK